MNQLLEVNLVEHRLQAALDAPDLLRFATIEARTVLIGGDKSPDWISDPLLHELATNITDSSVVILPGLSHLAPEDNPGPIATTLPSTQLDDRQSNPRASPLGRPRRPNGTVMPRWPESLRLIEPVG